MKVQFWKLATKLLHYLSLAITGCTVIVLLWDFFIMSRSRGYYFYVFACCTLLDLLEDCICFYKAIPSKSGQPMSRETFRKSIVQHVLTVAMELAAAHFDMKYIFG